MDSEYGLPETLFAVLVPSGTEETGEQVPVPLVVGLPSGQQPEIEALVLFGSREKVEAFVASPGFDVPHRIQEVPIQNLARVLRLHLETEQADSVLVDPDPPHLWEGPEPDVAGTVWRAEDMAKAVEEFYQ